MTWLWIGLAVAAIAGTTYFLNKRKQRRKASPGDMYPMW